MTKYEVMFIVKATIESDEVKKTVSGFYYLITTEASKDVIREFDRKLRINENVLRHLILKKESE